MDAGAVVGVLLLRAVRLEELEAVGLILVAILGELGLRTDVEVQVLLRVALRTPDPAVLRPGRVAATQTDVEGGESLLAIEHRDPSSGGQVLVGRTAGAVKLVVVEDEVVPAIVVRAVLADAPVQERTDGIVPERESNSAQMRSVPQTNSR